MYTISQYTFLRKHDFILPPSQKSLIESNLGLCLLSFHLVQKSILDSSTILSTVRMKKLIFLFFCPMIPIITLRGVSSLIRSGAAGQPQNKISSGKGRV